jgi:hypothetical protein
MSSLDLDVDMRMNRLEIDWHEAYEASISAHVDFESLSHSGAATPERAAKARARLEAADIAKAHIMAEIERLEESLLAV